MPALRGSACSFASLPPTADKSLKDRLRVLHGRRAMVQRRVDRGEGLVALSSAALINVLH